jgi:ubiquitin-conjugating enzyme E2 D/E
MSATSIRRLKKEWSDINQEIEKSGENITVKLINDEIIHWSARMKGPDDSPFENGIFTLDIVFPTEYPFKPPIIKFINKMYHPNINTAGAICLDILKDQWSPALSVFKVLLSISSLLADPNPNDPLNADVAGIYKLDKNKYIATAKEWTKLYANKIVN